ncbi:MAG: hypothetical protein K6A44_03830 [bacterium]|nr:hypothetical protein [bacterium]
MMIMKRIFSIYLIFSFLILPAMPVLAANIPTGVKIKKENNKYCLYDKNSQKLLIPCEYDEMKKISNEAVKVKKNNKEGILYNNGDVAIPVQYDVVLMRKEKDKSEQKNPQYYGINNSAKVVEAKLTKGTQFNFFDKYKNYPETNYIGNLKYLRLYEPCFIGDCKYKDINTIVYEKEKDNYFVYTAFDSWNDKNEFYFPDKKSLIDVSYFDSAIICSKDKKWGVITTDGKQKVRFDYDKILAFDAYIDEEILPDTNGNTYLNVKYNKISFPVKDKFIGIKGDKIDIVDINGKILYTGKKPSVDIDLYSPDLISQIISRNNINSVVRFSNYPKNGIIKYEENGKYGLILVNNGKNTKLDAMYSDFIFPDDNTVLFQLLGISFASLNNVLALKDNRYFYFPVDSIERYNHNTKGISSHPLQLTAKIKETITFDEFGANVQYDSIIMPNVDYNNLKKYPYDSSSLNLNPNLPINISDNKVETINDAKKRRHGESAMGRFILVITAPFWGIPVLIIMWLHAHG